jgi:hypothetical protein
MSDHVYALVDSDGQIEVRHQKPERPQAPDGKRWIDDILPAHDPATHKLEAALPVPDNATEVPYDIVERDLAAEAAAHQHNQDTEYVMVNAKDRAMYVLVELVSTLVVNGTITDNDFSPAAKQAYLDLKERVDRLTA